MSIGLYDADFFKYHQTIFNLEIMKLATYFKKKREITMLSPTFSPDKYTHFFYRKDFFDGTFPSELNQYKNIQFGGLAFSNNKYISLPEEIEVCAPDLTLYDRYKDLFIEDLKNNRMGFTTLRRNIHLRLSLDGKNLWRDFEKQISKNSRAKVFFIHDPNLGEIINAPVAIQYLLKKYSYSDKITSSLCPKFPIVCNDLKSFLKWNQFTYASIYFEVQLNWFLSDEELNEIVNNIYESNARVITYKPLPSSSLTNHILEEDLVRIFKQVLFLYKNHKQFLLICDDDFRIPLEIKNLFKLFTAYGRSKFSYPVSLFFFTKNLRETKKYHNELIDLNEAKEVFYFVQKKYPNLFKMFYENYGAIFKGGQLEIE